MDDFSKGVLYFLTGTIFLIVMFVFLASIGPLIFGVIDNAGAGAMGGASKVMIGMVGFVVSAAFIYQGLQLTVFGKQDNNRGYY